MAARGCLQSGGELDGSWLALEAGRRKSDFDAASLWRPGLISHAFAAWRQAAALQAHMQGLAPIRAAS